MISFNEYLTLKAKDLSGVGTKKSESAAICKIIECIKEQMIYIKSNNIKKFLEDVILDLIKRN